MFANPKIIDMWQGSVTIKLLKRRGSENMKFKSCLRVAAIIATMALLSLTYMASAQYQLLDWANFEKGKFQENSSPIGDKFDTTAKIVEYSQIPNMPPAFCSGAVANEVGKYGLQLFISPDIWMSGLAYALPLDRDRLGVSGRALYQADFYLPPVGEKLPGLAVLAMEQMAPGENRPHSFYRFGLTLNRFLYFSYVVKDELTARIFLQDESMFSKLPRPGWHRFAIVFEGPNRIRCYIDGHEATFSPVEEPTLRLLQVGILVAEKVEKYNCYADNLSIQWTPEDYPIPISPYAGTWANVPVSSTPKTNVAPTTAPVIPTSPEASAGAIGWLDTKVGWDMSREKQTPMLVFFSAPNVPSVALLDKIIGDEPQAQTFIKQFIPIRIDVNQLRGGDIAKNFNIFKLPTLVIVNPQGKEVNRAIFGRYDNWQTFVAKLQTK
jgi:hypothetical protein